MASPTPSSSCLAKTLIQVAYYHVGVDPEHVARLKFIAAKLPAIPFDLTAKNKALLRQFESEAFAGKAPFPSRAAHERRSPRRWRRAGSTSSRPRWRSPSISSSQSRSGHRISARLNWQRHFSEPDGPKGRLILHIPAAEMKSRREDFVAEVPDHVAQRLRWYRRHILPRLNADLNGDLFVTKKGKQEGSENHHHPNHQGHRALSRRPHDAAPVPAFRGTSYLDENPEDIETVRALLGHAWSQDHSDLCRLVEPARQPGL